MHASSTIEWPRESACPRTRNSYLAKFMHSRYLRQTSANGILTLILTIVCDRSHYICEIVAAAIAVVVASILSLAAVARANLAPLRARHSNGACMTPMISRRVRCACPRFVWWKLILASFFVPQASEFGSASPNGWQKWKYRIQRCRTIHGHKITITGDNKMQLPAILHSGERARICDGVVRRSGASRASNILFNSIEPHDCRANSLISIGGNGSRLQYGCCYSSSASIVSPGKVGG